ncbi:MAG: poly-beta-hydroxybutyrate polymerase N-terminal domain-containing protein, partial [Pseudomonadota bacterium]
MDAPVPLASAEATVEPAAAETRAGEGDRPRATFTAALDDFVLAMIANQTGGLSHFAIATALFDWSNHLHSPLSEFEPPPRRRHEMVA